MGKNEEKSKKTRKNHNSNSFSLYLGRGNRNPQDQKEYTKMMRPTCPATRALELQNHKTTTSKGSQGRSIDSKLSYELFSLNFDSSLNAFPIIEWDSNEDSDSLSETSSVRSMESWNSILTDTESSLGKRGRDNPKTPYRRLVRSKKIKSDLSSLAKGRPW